MSNILHAVLTASSTSGRISEVTCYDDALEAITQADIMTEENTEGSWSTPWQTFRPVIILAHEGTLIRVIGLNFDADATSIHSDLEYYAEHEAEIAI